MSLMALKKSRKRSDFVIYSHLGDSAFSAIKKDALQPRPQGFSFKNGCSGIKQENVNIYIVRTSLLNTTFISTFC